MTVPDVNTSRVARPVIGSKHGVLAGLVTPELTTHSSTQEAILNKAPSKKEAQPPQNAQQALPSPQESSQASS